MQAQGLCAVRVEAGGVLRRARTVESLVCVDLAVPAGQTVAVVGDGASGRRLLGGVLAGLVTPTAGRVVLDGADVTRAGRGAGSPERVLLLGPHAPSLPRRRRVRALLDEALRRVGGSPAGGAAGDVEALLAGVGLESSVLDRAAGSLEPVAAQRVATALAVAREVPVLVCDEPLADPAGRDLALRLLAAARAGGRGATVVLAEGLVTLPDAVERVVVLHGGRVLEDLPTRGMAHQALHPATHALLRAAGLIDGGGGDLAGVDAQSATLPSATTSTAAKGTSGTPGAGADDDGCVFRALCPRAQPRCATERPELTRPLGASHVVACHFPEAPRGHGAEVRTQAPDDTTAWSAEPTGRDFAEG